MGWGALGEENEEGGEQRQNEEGGERERTKKSASEGERGKRYKGQAVPAKTSNRAVFASRNACERPSNQPGGGGWVSRAILNAPS